jgi:uncharacterized protein
MYINVENTKEFTKKLQINLDDENFRLKNDAEIIGKLEVLETKVNLSGKIKTELETECSRCLSPINSTLDFSFKVGFVTEDVYQNELETELDDEDLELSIYDGEKIDLNELAQEQILLNLPTQVLCKNDCKGLCPKCGVNLNEKTCDCQTKEIDPRWANLKNLRF